MNNNVVITFESNVLHLSDYKENNIFIISKNPRLDFALIVNKLIELNKYSKILNEYEYNSFVGSKAKIGNDVIIESNVFIDDNVIVGSDTIIQSGVRIYGNVVIGKNTIIGANSTIGLAGFGVELDEHGKSVRIPHLGGVRIGNGVHISSLSNVHAGTIEPTIIGDNVQIDSLVHVGHNVKIGKSSIITASTEISGSTIIGENCYIGPNTSLMNKITLGDHVIVGLGSVVTKSFPDNVTIAGSPAKTTTQLRRQKAYASY